MTTFTCLFCNRSWPTRVRLNKHYGRAICGRRLAAGNDAAAAVGANLHAYRVHWRQRPRNHTSSTPRAAERPSDTDSACDSPPPEIPNQPEVSVPLPSSPSDLHSPQRAVISDEPDDDPEIVDKFPGAARRESKLKTPLIQSDFAAFTGEYGPFPSKADWDLAHWSTIEGVSQSAISRLLDSDAANPALAASSARHIKAQISALPSSTKFNHAKLSVPGMVEPFDLYYRNAIDVVADLLADPAFADVMSFAPERRWADATRTTRIYNEMSSGDWWHEIQVRICCYSRCELLVLTCCI